MKTGLAQLVKDGAEIYGHMQNSDHFGYMSVDDKKLQVMNGIPVQKCIEAHNKWLVRVHEYGHTHHLLLPHLIFDEEIVNKIYNHNSFPENLYLKDFEKLMASLREQIQYLEKTGMESPVATTSQFYAFTLSKDGKLTRGINPSEEYAMSTTDMRYKLLKALATHSETHFKSTQEWAKLLKTSDEQLRKCVGDIKRRAKRFKGIKGADFIIGKKGSGYRLGNLIKIDVL